mgnify:CR=1 FL=1
MTTIEPRHHILSSLIVDGEKWDLVIYRPEWIRRHGRGQTAEVPITEEEILRQQKLKEDLSIDSATLAENPLPTSSATEQCMADGFADASRTLLRRQAL